MSERIPRVAVAVALAALVAWSFDLRWQILTASPFPLGIDGYFYPIQVRSLLEHGTLAYPASPLTFWWMAPFAAATDPITGAKLGAALGGALIALPAYAVGARLGKGRGPGLVAAAITSAAGSSVYLSLEFVKQGIGLTVMLAALWLALRAIEAPTRRRLGAAAAGVLAAYLAHKLAAALVVAIAVPAAIEDARRRGALHGRRLFYALAGVIVAVVVLAVLGAVWPQRFPSLGDLALLGGLFDAHARWSAPALVTPHTTLAFDHEALVGVIVGLAAAAVLVLAPVERSVGERIACWCAVGLALAIGLPWLAVADPQGLAFRLRVAAFVPLALASAIALSSIPGLARDVACVAIGIAIAIIGSMRSHTEGEVITHPALVSAALEVADYAPSNATLIVPERHILFMVAWYARAKVALRPDDVPYAQRVRLVPLAFIGAGSRLDAALDSARKEAALAPPIGVHPRHRNGLVLVEEATWDWILTQLPDRSRHYYAAWPTI